MHHYTSVAEQFAPYTRVLTVDEFGNGNINDTYYEYLFDSIRLLTFELGVRFFTDYLAGNVYFKVKHAEPNLQRALVQFKLTESIEAYEADIRHIIQGMVSPAI